MASRIRIKMGAVEVEYEGPEEFLKKDLPELLSAVSQLYAQRQGNEENDLSDRLKGDVGGNGIVGTTATIAGKLSVKSAPELIIAGAAHLTLVAKKAEFSRKELLEQIQGASGYYKDTMGRNFTNYLNSRVKSGELVEPRSGHYALSAAKKTELRKTLAT
jgi:hypothetical protein